MKGIIYDEGKCISISIIPHCGQFEKLEFQEISMETQPR